MTKLGNHFLIVLINLVTASVSPQILLFRCFPYYLVYFEAFLKTRCNTITPICSSSFLSCMHTNFSVLSSTLSYSMMDIDIIVYKERLLMWTEERRVTNLQTFFYILWPRSIHSVDIPLNAIMLGYMLTKSTTFTL